jgi:hypothetical protein
METSPEFERWWNTYPQDPFDYDLNNELKRMAWSAWQAGREDLRDNKQ